MKMINTALIALTIVSASAVGAYARDGLPSRTTTQSAMDTYASNEAIFETRSSPLNSADREIIRQNELGQR
jgi:hypothetical protein